MARANRSACRSPRRRSRTLFACVLQARGLLASRTLSSYVVPVRFLILSIALSSWALACGETTSGNPAALRDGGQDVRSSDTSIETDVDASLMELSDSSDDAEGEMVPPQNCVAGDPCEPGSPLCQANCFLCDCVDAQRVCGKGSCPPPP
jgi:hypothetical protein